jgi:hypothetical protein
VEILQKMMSRFISRAEDLHEKNIDLGNELMTNMIELEKLKQ